MPGVAQVRDPWSSGDLNQRPADPLQVRRGTAASLASSNLLLAAGELAWETDTSQGKVGNGTVRYNSLPYTLGGSSSSLSLPAGTMAGNDTASAGPASGLTPSQIRALAEVPWIDTFSDLSSDVTVHVGAVHTPVNPTHSATSNAASSIVTAAGAVPFPAHFYDGAPVYGPGVRPYTYIRAMAANRLTFTLSSNPTVTTAVNADAGGAGSGAFSTREPYSTAHGIYLHGLPVFNPLSQVRTGRSGSIQLPTAAPPAEQYYEGWYKGEYWMKSAEYPTAERVFPSDAYTPILKHIYIPVSSAGLHSWAGLTTTPAVFGNQYILYIPLEGATQAKIMINWQGSTATGGSGAKLRAEYNNGSTWVNLAASTSAIDAPLDAGGLQPHEGTWGNITAAALTRAATLGDRLLVRIVGLTVTTPGTPTFGQIELWTKP